MAQIEGLKELDRKLRELANPKEQLTTLRAAVRTPMKKVMAAAQVTVGVVSPGAAETHKAYDGLILNRGYASRSLRVVVKTSKDKQSVSALLGVRKRAYYALQFFELGTARIPAQPWLVPAFESSKDATVKGVADVLRKRITRIAKKRAAKT